MSDNFNFEKALEELNTIVNTMEKGGVPLQESVELFEKAMVLTQACQEELKKAEQKVQILLEKDGKWAPNDYQPEE